MILQLMALALISYILWFYLIYVRRYPKGPTPFPIVGNLLQLPGVDLHTYLDKLGQKYGPVYTVFMPAPNVILTTNDDIRECLVARAEHFVDTSPVFDLISEIPFPHGGVASSNGENWREQRRLALHILRDAGMGKGLMELKIMHQTEILLHHFETASNPKRVEFFLPFQLATGNIINELIFGNSFDPSDCDRLLSFLNILTEYFQQVLSPAMTLHNNWPWTKHIPLLNSTHNHLKAKMEHYHRFIAVEVHKQMKEFQPHAPANNLVHSYLQAMEDDPTNNYLNVDQLKCVASDFWMAGMESTVTFLKWAILYMMAFPHAQRKAAEEIDRVVGHDRYVTSNDRVQMPYVTALIYEIERYAMVGMTTFRTCATEQQIHQHHIPANTNYLFNFYSINKRNGVDSDEDEKTFRPERWLEGDGLNLKKEVVNKFQAFGLGRRACPGESLAKMELFLIISNLLQKFEFLPAEKADGSGEVEEIDLTYTYGIILYPKEQLCRVVKRY